ncbi:MAG: hypothetical protein HC882_07640 [Acidobacteria bacterium]|nr:hypothetical protein [Acidobacteriota bacterium]
MLDFLGLSPDTVDVVCPIPGDVLRIRLVPGESDTLLIGPDGEELPWPPDQGALPDPDTWIDHFVGGVQPGDYLFAWNGVPFWIGEVTAPMFSLRAPSSGSFVFQRIGL